MYSKGAEDLYIEFNTAKINIFDSTGNNNYFLKRCYG